MHTRPKQLNFLSNDSQYFSFSGIGVYSRFVDSATVARSIYPDVRNL